MSSHRLPQGSVTQTAQHWVDFQTGKIQKDPLKKLTVTEQYYNELFEEYKERQFNEFTTTRIIIPKGTRMMVWNDHRSFVGDMLTYIDHWKNRGNHTFIIPKGKELSVEHYSTKDIDIPLVIWSTLLSHIIANKMKTEYSVLDDSKRYGLWIKMYEEPTYIPQLDKKIVAYGVWEQDIPEAININPSRTNTTLNNYSGPTMLTNKMRTAYNWTCKYCGGDTSQIDMDYLSGVDHLGCELQNSMGANC